MLDLSSGSLFAGFRDFSRHLIFNCAIIGEPSGSSAFIRYTHFIWVAKMADQTSCYAIVCCTYSGNVRSCTWRVNMATVSSVSVVSSVFIWICCQHHGLFHEVQPQHSWHIGGETTDDETGLYKTTWPTNRYTTWNLSKSQNTQSQWRASMTVSGHHQNCMIHNRPDTYLAGSYSCMYW
jgi:hypothetical protein